MSFYKINNVDVFDSKNFRYASNLIKNQRLYSWLADKCVDRRSVLISNLSLSALLECYEDVQQSIHSNFSLFDKNYISTIDFIRNFTKISEHDDDDDDDISKKRCVSSALTKEKLNIIEKENDSTNKEEFQLFSSNRKKIFCFDKKIIDFEIKI